jgi:hypothetical protein
MARRPHHAPELPDISQVNASRKQALFTREPKKVIFMT